MSFETKLITEIVEFNPNRPIKKGTVSPFIDMAALPVSNRDIAEITYKEFNGGGAKFCNGDTLFARITPCLENGKTAKVSSLPENVNGFGSTEFIVMAAKEPSYDENFVYYLARLPEFRAFAKARMEGTSGRQRVAWQSIAEFKLPLPDKNQRKMIGEYLRALDDKILANTQTNQTLEQMAQAIFKSWFVDFDPVKAKMNGEQPEGMDAATASLFPDKLVESELGLIPDGWEEIALYDIAEFINGAAYKKFEPNGERLGLPIVKIAELKMGITPNTGFSTVDMPKKYKLENEDILFSWSGNPDTSIDTFVWALGEAWLNQHIFKVVPNSEFSRDYVLCLLKFMRPIFAEIARDKQTTGLGHVTVKDLKRLMIAMPSKETLIKFNEKVGAIIAHQFNLVIENQTLTNLRDTLLPKLLSGEIQLENAETLKELEPVL